MIEELKEPCRKCLLRQIDEDDILNQIKKAISKIKPDEKTTDNIYEERLRSCTQCEYLVSGTCMKCGCYVELRAAFSKNHCPLVGSKKKW